MQAGIPNFEKIPDEVSERKRFAKLFKDFNEYLEAAKVQGFVWSKLSYSFTDEETGENSTVELLLDEKTYLILALRYKELFTESTGGDGDDAPYDLADI
jgi:type I restriction enzyme R subunit